MRFAILVFAPVFWLTACSESGSLANKLGSPKVIAIDSQNGRLVVLDNEEAVLSIIDTSTNDVIGDDPLIDEDHATDLLAAVTASPLDAVAIPSPADATITRSFITGAVLLDGAQVGNRIHVFDYNGTAISAASFSPIAVSDGDDATDETDHVLPSLAVDETNDIVFVLDKTAAELRFYSSVDGSENASSPIAITGTPSRLAIDTELRRLFIAGIADDATLQVLTTIDLDDFTDITEIAMGVPLKDIGVVTTAAGTVLVGLQSDDAQMTAFTVNTDTFLAVTEIASIGNTEETSETDDDEDEETLVTGTLAQVDVVRDSADQVFAYASQSDGNILVLKISADLGTVTSFALETRNELQNNGAALKDPSTGDAAVIYVSSPFDGLVVVTAIGDEEEFSRIR